MRVPYKLTAAMPIEYRLAQMRAAINSGFPRIQQQMMNEAASISIACYGPSLSETWQDLTRPIISVSGSLKFLHERGITPDYHVDMDPREHKTKHIDPPVPGVHYIMASVCSPKTWEILKDQNVTLWHVDSRKGTDEWVRTNDPGTLLVTSGSTVGLGAIQIGGILGYRHFEIHGMDASLREGARHAGPHYGHKQGGYTWAAGGYKYETSKIMANAAAETLNACRIYPIFCVFHGSGLTQALLDEEYDLDNIALAGTPKANMVRKAKFQFIGYRDDFEKQQQPEQQAEA